MLQITEITKTFTNNTVLDITTSGKNGLSGSGNRLCKELFSFWEYFFTFKLWNKMKTNIPNEDWRNVNLERFIKFWGKNMLKKKPDANCAKKNSWNSLNRLITPPLIVWKSYRFNNESTCKVHYFFYQLEFVISNYCINPFEIFQYWNK